MNTYPETAVALKIPGLTAALSLYVHGEQDLYVSQQIREQGVWEPYETQLLCRLLYPGAVFVDIGANIGYFSILAANLIGPDGHVFAFEPDPQNCRLFSSSIALNSFQSRIDLVAAGLADVSSSGELFLSEDNFGDHQVYAGEQSRRSVPIELYHGGNYLTAHTDHIDLIKIDTQGAEFAVLSGLEQFLLTLPVMPQIMVELTPFSLRQAGASGRRLIELLARLKQTFWIIDHIEHRLVESSADELALWCDNVDACAGDQGFMNILVGPGPK